MAFKDGMSCAVHPDVVGGIWTCSGDLTGPAGREHGVAAGDGRAGGCTQQALFAFWLLPRKPPAGQPSVSSVAPGLEGAGPGLARGSSFGPEQVTDAVSTRSNDAVGSLALVGPLVEWFRPPVGMPWDRRRPRPLRGVRKGMEGASPSDCGPRIRPMPSPECMAADTSYSGFLSPDTAGA